MLKCISVFLIILSATFSLSADPTEAKKKLQNLKIEFTESAFIDQVNSGNIRAVRLFLQAGMSPDATGQHQMSAIQFAAIQGHKEVVKSLIDAKANLNAKDAGGGTALKGAVINGHPDLIPLLVQAGADVNASDDQGNTVLHDFIQAPTTAWQPPPSMEWVRTLQRLIEVKANVNAANENGMTPLMIAAQGPLYPMKPQEQQEAIYAEMVNVLLKAGAEVNAQEKEYSATALMLAASKGYAKVVSALLQGGADASIKGTKGMTAIDLAKEYPEVQKLLQSHRQ